MTGSSGGRSIFRLLCVFIFLAAEIKHANAEEIHPGQNCFGLPGVNCVSMQIESAAADAGVVAVTGANPGITVETTVNNSPGISSTPPEIVPGGFVVSTFKELGEIFIGILSSKSGIQPSFTNGEVSAVDTHVRIEQQLIINGPTPTVDLGLEIDINGDMCRPPDPGPGGILLNYQWAIESVLNGNPILTTVFDASLSYDESDTMPDVRGASAASAILTPNGPDAAGNTGFGYQSQDELFDSVQIQTGVPFTLQGSAFSQVFANGFDGEVGQ